MQKLHNLYRFALTAATALLLFSCNGGNRTAQRLCTYADSLKRADEVIRTTDSLLAHTHTSRHQKALLRLAKAKAMFVKHFFSPQFPTGLDSLIDSSVATMERHGYKERLAEAHYFQGMIQSLFFGRQVEGMVALEKARLEVPDDNLDLQSRIYQQLGSVYELMGNLDMAINYMRRVIAIEKRRRDPMVIMVNSYNIHTLFRKNGQTDSADYYLRLVIRKRPKFKDPRFNVFNESFGTYYLEHHDLRRARYYYDHALRTDGRLPEVQLGLAQIARLERRPAEARRHLQLAEAMADTLFSTNQNYRMAMPYFLRRLAACHHADGNTLQELRALARLDSLSTVMNRANERLVNKATLLEQDYLARLIEKQHRREVRFTVAIIVLASLIAAILAFFFVRRLVRSYHARLYTATQRSYKQAYEIGKLKTRIEEMPIELTDKIQAGKPLYEAIALGRQTMKDWGRKELECYINYARLADKEIFSLLDTNYNQLATKPTIFLYLWKKGYTDTDISRIMSVSNGSIRTMRYNIRKQQKESL